MSVSALQPGKLSDLDLVDLMREGSALAFEELYTRYWSKLYSSAYKRIRIKEVAEEIVQDFFTSLWLNRERLIIHTSFQNYLYNSVRYLVFAYISKEYSRKTYEELQVKQAGVFRNVTEDDFEVKELEHSLNKALVDLPEKCRSVFEMSRKQYKTNREIASLLGISEKTVEQHLTKALKRLRFSMKYFISLLFLGQTWL